MFTKNKINHESVHTEKAPYEKPVVIRIVIHNADIITESYIDPNQGEWDYEE